VELLKENGGHLTTGFIGTPYFCRALSDNGRLDEAYALLLKEDYPSWLYQITRGATTIWEHWDGIKPDGSLWSVNMNSFNHYAYGSVGDWLYRVVGGLDAEEPGYKKIRFEPRPGGGLTWARVKYTTPYGPASLEWRLEGGDLRIEALVPHNTTARLIFPHDGSVVALGSGFHTFRHPHAKG
jgi:alpha-L-rhamnosidase